MILLDKLLFRLREKGHRVLVFSQMVRMLDILSDYRQMRGFPFLRLDGSMPNDLRVRAVDHYNDPESTDFIFLISTRGRRPRNSSCHCRYGFIFDSDWNPQNSFQAEFVHIAFGQTKDVKVFRLHSRETVEEDILGRAKRIPVLEHLVIHGVEGDEQDKDGKDKFNKQEFKAILLFGAEKIFKETGPTPDDGLVGSSVNGGNSTGAPGLSPAEDANREEGRVLEVHDIDKLCHARRRSPKTSLELQSRVWEIAY
jgi:Helicase conserved C-terminal domain